MSHRSNIRLSRSRSSGISGGSPRGSCCRGGWRVHGTVGTRTLPPKLVIKGTRISFQNGLSGLINGISMQRGVIASLAFAFWSTCRTQGKALTIQFQATVHANKTTKPRTKMWVRTQEASRDVSLYLSLIFHKNKQP
jgi:hypothetical protein